jgi:hypothetical protein
VRAGPPFCSQGKPPGSGVPSETKPPGPTLPSQAKLLDCPL